MNYIRKNLVSIIAVSAIIIGLLGLANLIKFGYISADVLVKNKDLIEVINNLFTGFIFIIGATVSYFRFFKGRVFSNSANVELSVSIHKLNDDLFLHAVSLNIKNDGSFPIWEPVPTLLAYPHGLTDVGTVVNIPFWESEIQKTKDNIRVVNPLESEQFYAFYHVSKNISVVTYVAQVKSRNNVKWTKTATVSNQITKAG